MKNLEVYVIGGRELSRGRPQGEVIEAALAGGATAVQLREKDLAGRELLALAREYRELTRKYSALFIVNDRVDIALAVEADGVHLGQEDLPAPVARRLLGPEKIIGISVDNVEEALQAQAAGADYVGLGPFFPTASKTDTGKPVTLDTLRAVKAAISIPVVAIGGITAERAGDIIAAGADGVAVISAVVGAPDVKLAAQQLAAAVRAGKERRK
ncbi:MAG: thiamine phosphate synthase [bacterium]|jgi:thiamine-phosphate pyrophosphorylase|nr:thiamine phosphate synthase [Bacillota bacterium]HHW55256.1 thiamine phosphate synthase [Bacillota bacterium]